MKKVLAFIMLVSTIGSALGRCTVDKYQAWHDAYKMIMGTRHRNKGCQTGSPCALDKKWKDTGTSSKKSVASDEIGSADTEEKGIFTLLYTLRRNERVKLAHIKKEEQALWNNVSKLSKAIKIMSDRVHCLKRFIADKSTPERVEKKKALEEAVRIAKSLQVKAENFVNTLVFQAWLKDRDPQEYEKQRKLHGWKNVQRKDGRYIHISL